MKSAWSAHFSKAPKDGRHILMRNAEWDCPAIVRWDEVEGCWMLAETALAEIDDGIIDTSGAEWALIPE